MVNEKYIGIFDSGLGGLTVLEDLKKTFPNENFLYFGDTLRCPYGTKTKEELERIVESDIRYLEECDVKMIVIACNTATANSYHIESKVPIVRIIEPTCEIANKQKGNLLVLATNYTIKSNAYSKFLNDLNYYRVCCSEWVDIIENGKAGTDISRESANRLLGEYKNKVDNVILACTHFGLMEKEIKEVIGDVNIINSSKCLKDKVKEVLDKIGYNSSKEAKVIIQCSGKKEDFNISYLDLKYDVLEEIKIK